MNETIRRVLQNELRRTDRLIELEEESINELSITLSERQNALERFLDARHDLLAALGEEE